MRVPLATSVLGLILLNALSVTADPFAFFARTVKVSASERAALARGHVVVRRLPSLGNEVGMLTIIATKATPAQLVTLARDIRQFKADPVVRAVGRISSPAAARDFEGMPVSNDELTDLRECRSGNCGVKLTDAEIAAVRAALPESVGRWPARVAPLLRELLAERVRQYQRGGLGAMPTANDGRDDLAPASAFEIVLNGHPYLRASQPELSAFLTAGGAPPTSVRDSYLYWSAEDAGGKLVTSVTELTIVHTDAPGVPPVMVVGKQVLATHYYVGSLNVMALCKTTGGPGYLVTINRSRVDLVSGPFRGVVLSTIERRIRGAAPAVMAGLKRRLEATVARD